jgi:nucleotide-binding universal stress UspA family protein
MKTVRRLLCATDLSAASRPAWEHAQHLGRLFGAEVLLLHVLPVAPVPTTPDLPWGLIDELRQIGERQAREGLDALLDGSRDSGVKTRARLELGTPTARILEVAREEAAMSSSWEPTAAPAWAACCWEAWRTGWSGSRRVRW